jgi:hypothetical protein
MQKHGRMMVKNPNDAVLKPFCLAVRTASCQSHFLFHLMIRLLSSPAILLLALCLSACDPKPDGKLSPQAPLVDANKTAAISAPVESVKEKPAASAKPDPAQLVDMSEFGSLEPLDRPDMPDRGVIRFGPESYQHANQAHWETYTWTEFKAKRPGRYQVRLTYMLRRAALGIQFRMGDLTEKRSLKSSPNARKVYLGEVYVPQAGEVPFMMLTPPTEDGGFKVLEVALIPAPEGPLPAQGEDGKITLPASSATTWSETMRYEPQPEKNCLGYWTDENDFAEWEFQPQKAGRYTVTVSYGCGGGNHGSEVELKVKGQTLKWTTQDTGGFQTWQDVSLGEIEISKAGPQRLIIAPVNKVKSAILDVQKVVLTPAG